MKRAMLLLTLLGTVALAQHDEHAHHSAVVPAGDAQIVVTINPEARVSVAVAAPMPVAPNCRDAIELKVRIANQGFVTAPLRAAMIGDGQGRVALHMDASKLSGAPDDVRLLHLIPLVDGPTDVTLAFSIDNNIGDLGGRDRVHLLLRCSGWLAGDRVRPILEEVGANE